MSSGFFHIDIDAFFASVEQVDEPSYRGKPVIVGARPGARGVVSTCSYEARAFGVHSAMPISEAARLCPQGIFLPVRMERYREKSDAVFAVFDRYSPDVRPVSIDEAFLDMRGTERLFGPLAETAGRIKAEIRNETGLTISVGMAPNRFLAKLASAASKPDGLLCVEEGGEEAFMDRIPLAKLWGAGERTQERLRELNIRDMAALRALERPLAQRLLGRATGDFLYMASRGIDPGIFSDTVKSQSLSTERTFERDIADDETLEAILLELCQEIVFSLYKRGATSRCLALKLRYSDFSTLSAQESREEPISSVDEAFAIARSLLKAKRSGPLPVRLLGVGFSGLSANGMRQGLLFGDEGKKEKLDRAVNALEERGGTRLARARTIRPPSPKRPNP